MNVTVPVAETPLGAPIDAVRTIACPNVDGFTLDEIAVVVAAGVTDSLIVLDELPAKFASPLYRAVIECVPPFKLETVSWTVSVESGTVPRVAPPSRNVTVPPAKSPAIDGVTVAVNVTDCAKTTGFTLAAKDTEDDTGVTVSVSGAEVLPVKLLSPP